MADKNDKFEREPYVVVFDLKDLKKNSTKLQFALIGIHVKASKNLAFEEIELLYDVAEGVKRDKKIANIVVMG